MSGGTKFSRIPAWAADMDLTAADWRVLHAIGLYADKAGHAYPSLERIAKIAHIERRHVTRSTKRLARLGLIRYERLPQGDGWANNRYQILYDVPAEVFPPVGTPEGIPKKIPEVFPELGTPDQNCRAVTQPKTPANASFGVPTGGNRGVPSLGSRGVPTGGVPSDGALTEESYQEEVEKGLGDLEQERVIASKAGPGVPSDGSSPADRPNGPACHWYVTNGTGYRFCGKPAVPGSEYCAKHRMVGA
jgi:hypothetical protein